MLNKNAGSFVILFAFNISSVPAAEKSISLKLAEVRLGICFKLSIIFCV